MTRTFGWVLILLIILSAGCAQESSQDHLANAKAYLGESRSDAAIIELKSALQLSGDLAEARWLLGKIYLDIGDIDSAVKELRLARQFGCPSLMRGSRH